MSVALGEPQVVARAGAGGQVVGICMGPGPAQVRARMSGARIGGTRAPDQHTSADCPHARLQVTCTLVPYGVQVIDVPTSTCVLSWNLKGRAPLLPAAVVGAGERLVLACDDGAVLSWRAREMTDLAKADVLKGKGRAGRLQRLLVDPALEAVLLVYADGNVSVPCAACLRLIQFDMMKQRSGTCMLIWSTACRCGC